MFDTNVIGLVHTFAPFVAAMRAARRGALVGIASIAGFRGLPGSGAYSASKAAAIAYLESLRIELRGSGVAVLTICPGVHRNADDREESVSDAVPARRGRGRAAHRRVPSSAGRRFYVLPWPMAIVGRVLRMLPRPIYDALFAHAPRKPRQPG